MADWNPSLYLQFDAERTRPAADLLSRIAHLQVEHAVDLGCGPGNSTRLLRAAWPLAACATARCDLCQRLSAVADGS